MKSKGKAKAAGVFDAAIDILNEAISRSYLREELCSPEKWSGAMDACRLAIAVLEAAGKVRIEKDDYFIVRFDEEQALLRAIWEAQNGKDK